VPLREARRLEETLKRLGGSPWMHVYPNEGHIMSLPTYADIVQRSVNFLHRNLKLSAP
jgi:dipeptidyl aminopeptidase/acylaminoacyl peptidase